MCAVMSGTQSPMLIRLRRAFLKKLIADRAAHCTLATGERSSARAPRTPPAHAVQTACTHYTNYGSPPTLCPQPTGAETAHTPLLPATGASLARRFLAATTRLAQPHNAAATTCMTLPPTATRTKPTCVAVPVVDISHRYGCQPRLVS